MTQIAPLVPSTRLLKLRLRFEVLLWRYGWCWLLLAVLLAFTLCIQWLVLPNQKAAQQTATQQLLLWSQSAASTADKPAAASQVPLGETERLERLLDAVYSEGELNEALLQIIQTAKHNAIALEQSEFQTSTTGHGGLLRVQITLPIKATYPQFKAFVKDLLKAQPGVSFDELVINRDSVSLNELEIRAKLSVWVLPSRVAKGTP